MAINNLDAYAAAPLFFPRRREDRVQGASFFPTRDYNGRAPDEVCPPPSPPLYFGIRTRPKREASLFLSFPSRKGKRGPLLIVRANLLRVIPFPPVRQEEEPSCKKRRADGEAFRIGLCSFFSFPCPRSVGAWFFGSMRSIPSES